MADPRSDLVSVDDAGVVRAVGKAAMQRLRGHKGMWRLLPGPMQVLLLRHQPDEPSVPPAQLRLAGEIVGGSVCDVFAQAARGRWRGELVVVALGSMEKIETRVIFFEDGVVVAARSDSIGERLGEVMYKLGILDAQQVQAVIARMPFDTRRRFGETALDLGFITRDQLFHSATRQAEEIVFAAMRVSVGALYFFDAREGTEDARLVARVHLPAEALLVEGIERIDQIEFFRARIPSSEHVPAHIEGRTDPPLDAYAGTIFADVVKAIDGNRSILEIGRMTGRTEFEVTHAIFQLLQSGSIVVHPPAATTVEAVVAIFNDAMKAIHEASARIGRERALMEHLASYRATVGVLDGVFAGAGPRDDGTVDPARVTQNVSTLAGQDPKGALADWLHEYVAFALFDVGADMPKADHGVLSRQVRARLTQLAPPSSATVPPPVRRRPQPPPPPKRGPPKGPPRSLKETQREVKDKPPAIPPVSPLGVSGPKEETILKFESIPPPLPSFVPPMETAALAPAPAPAPAPGPAPVDVAAPIPLPHASSSSLDAMALADSVGAPPPAQSPATIAHADPAPVAPAAPLAPLAPFTPPAAFPPLPPTPLASSELESLPPPQPRRRSRVGLWALAFVLFAGTAVCAFALVRRLESSPPPTTTSKPAAKAKKPAKVEATDEEPSAATPSVSVSVSVSALVSASASASVSASASAPPSATASAPPALSASAATDASVAVAADQTALSTSAGGVGHRIYVDGRVVGEGPGPLVAPCGSHQVRIGSQGAPKTVDLPCGGAITITP